jgi:hypothetical protein
VPRGKLKQFQRPRSARNAHWITTLPSVTLEPPRYGQTGLQVW